MYNISFCFIKIDNVFLKTNFNYKQHFSSKFISSVGGVEFYDEIESIKKEIKKLRDNGVNIIIALGHSGIEKDQEIAKEVEDIDLIVGGHSHTFLYSGE